MSRMPTISSLMSPPELKPLDSFSPIAKSTDSPSTPTEDRLTHSVMFSKLSPEPSASRVLPSPPVSPWTGNDRKLSLEATKPLQVVKEAEIKDPILYPDNEDGENDITIDEPLFPSSPVRVYAEELVSKHMESHMSRFGKKTNRPTREEYLLALSFVSNVSKAYNHNPGQYLKRIREETDEQYGKAKRICGAPGFTHVRKIEMAPAPFLPAIKPQRKPVSTPKIPKLAVPRKPRTPKASPREKFLDYTLGGRSATPEARAKRPEDVDYNALPDYCPPLSTLPAGTPKALKTDWASNNPLNLSNDPDRHMLHEAEVNLASTLRLTCATYLCSKRRIFEGRLRAYKIGREFRKTDAQQACKIDVNKASKLWTAYDKVGWFNKAYFEKYILN